MKILLEAIVLDAVGKGVCIIVVNARGCRLIWIKNV